ncbi:MAG: fluoride efflux transporter CrcB [Clostridia bacterium]|nr:fluoride efflux transporter CrcB [Clostridia bacterium]
MEYVFVGLGGVFGALSRYGLSKWVGQRWRGDFPLATFLINITGSFVMGLLYVLFSRASAELVFLKHLTTTGFLGAYTTYSTFSYEIIGLIEDGEKSTAVKYFLTSIIVGLVSAYAGIVLAGQL